MKTQTKIDPQEWYTLQDIVRGKMFPWLNSFISIRNLVAQDRDNKNVLKANITGTGRATKYHFKGENIIKFISEFDAGKAKL